MLFLCCFVLFLHCFGTVFMLKMMNLAGSPNKIVLAPLHNAPSSPMM